MKYDSGLLDKVFVRTLDTALTSEVIRQEIVGLLTLDKMPQLEEEEFIEHFTESRRKEERSSKLFKKKPTGANLLVLMSQV